MTFLLSEVSGGDSHSQSGQANKQAAQQQNKPNKTHSLTAGPGPVQHKPTQNKTKSAASKKKSSASGSNKKAQKTAGKKASAGKKKAESSKKKELAAKKKGSPTKKKGSSTKKKGSSTKKKGSSTKKKGSSTKKKGSSTKKKGSSTKKKGSSAKRKGSSSKKKGSVSKKKSSSAQKGGSPAKKGLAAKNQKKKQSGRQASGCLAENCLDLAVSYIGLIRNRVTNYQKQISRISRLQAASLTKSGKQNSFTGSLNQLITAGGGNSSNLTCGQSQNNSGKYRIWRENLP